MLNTKLFLSLLFVAACTAVPSLNTRACDPDFNTCCRPSQFSCGDDCCSRSETCTTNSICAPRITSISPQIRIQDWYPVREGGTQTPQFAILGDGFSYGSVKVGIYNSANDRRIWETAISAEWAGGPPGGSFEARSDVLDCGASVGIPAYARAFDSTKGAWSGKVALTAGNCRNL